MDIKENQVWKYKKIYTKVISYDYRFVRNLRLIALDPDNIATTRYDFFIKSFKYVGEYGKYGD